jgi:cation diffusion facilitator family transporter
MEQRIHKSMLVVYVGVAANALLALLKVSIGILGSSPALLADGVNSTSDVAYGIVVTVFLKLSGKPADHEHPYGHDQLENIAAVVVGAFVITTAIAIFWNTVNHVYALLTVTSDYAGASIVAFWVAIFAIFLKIGLTAWTSFVGKQTQNKAVMALAHDHLNDIFASLAAAAGIFFGRMGYPWVDPLAGTIVSLIILYTGFSIIRSATEDLMATLPGKKLAKQIKELLSPLKGVKEVEEVHAHRFGPYVVVNITIGVDGELTVSQGDAIATQVEAILMEKIEYMRRVYVHYHPVGLS